jgi:chitinase
VAVAGYRVYRNGLLIATTTATSLADALPRKITSATYYVVGFDASGNLSAPSNVAAAKL